MDPIADKLLIIAALVSLVSLVSRGRLEAWVAMVIIAREFAVTVLRAAVGAQQGVVISASQLGKLKTAAQVIMVLVLIAVGSRPLWVSLLVCVTVAITVASGADYLFGLRRFVRPEPGAPWPGPPRVSSGLRGVGARQPALQRRLAAG
jgi:CDP-diacylglycerol--glycerol-3-phosphate 3-phosphatidyltransferase